MPGYPALGAMGPVDSPLGWPYSIAGCMKGFAAVMNGDGCMAGCAVGCIVGYVLGVPAVYAGGSGGYPVCACRWLGSAPSPAACSMPVCSCWGG
jgi:hypothetical protein